MPPYRKDNIANWISEGHTSVCCVCNSWQQRRSCPTVTVRGLLKAALQRTALEEKSEAFLASEDLVGGVTLDAENETHQLRWCCRCRDHVKKHLKLPAWAWTFHRQCPVPDCLRFLNRIERQLLQKVGVAQRLVVWSQGEQVGLEGLSCLYLHEEPRAYKVLKDCINDTVMTQFEKLGLQLRSGRGQQ